MAPIRKQIEVIRDKAFLAQCKGDIDGVRAAHQEGMALLGERSDTESLAHRVALGRILVDALAEERERNPRPRTQGAPKETREMSTREIELMPEASGNGHAAAAPEAAAKTCKACGAVRPLEEFRKSNFGGRIGTCNACMSERMKAAAKTARPRGSKQPQPEPAAGPGVPPAIATAHAQYLQLLAMLPGAGPARDGLVLAATAVHARMVELCGGGAQVPAPAAGPVSLDAHEC
jgi:hypothetical protein